MITVGVISDTHGLLRPEVFDCLQGCQHIIHAGDIGSPEIIAELENIAPLNIIRGNVDKADWAKKIPATDFFQIDKTTIYCLHNLQHLDLDPKAAELDLVISGHTHQPALFEKDGVSFLNPGSIGPRRFSYPISMAKIYLNDEQFNVEFISF